MAHFAELDENNVVLRVLVIDNNEMTVDGVENEQLGIDFLNDHYPESGTWIQTSYNGKIRGQFAGAGAIYLPDRDLFQYGEKPYPSWTLDDDGIWRPPESANEWLAGYNWDENSLSFVKPDKPHPSWTWIDDETHSGGWYAPVPHPWEGIAPEELEEKGFDISTEPEWNEETQKWDEA